MCTEQTGASIDTTSGVSYTKDEYDRYARIPDVAADVRWKCRFRANARSSCLIMSAHTLRIIVGYWKDGTEDRAVSVRNRHTFKGWTRVL